VTNVQGLFIRDADDTSKWRVMNLGLANTHARNTTTFMATKNSKGAGHLTSPSCIATASVTSVCLPSSHGITRNLLCQAEKKTDNESQDNDR
jgi:hypothetical protein